MQLDTEEGETFVPPAGVVASSNVEPSAPANDSTDARALEESATGTAAEPQTES